MTQKRLFGISGAIATAALIGGLLAGCMEKDLYDPNYGIYNRLLLNIL